MTSFNVLIVCTAATVSLMFVISLHFVKLRRKCCSKKKEKVIAFFHPRCSAGGGGERVLWKQVEALGQMKEEGTALRIAIYTSDKPSRDYKRGKD